MERNIEALKELRRVAIAAPEDLLHMAVVTEKAPCGTAHCLMGWAMVDPYFRGLDGFPKGGRDWFTSMVPRAAKALGLEEIEAHCLFATSPHHLTFSLNPHAISKAEVLWNLDELIAGRDAGAYEATQYAHAYGLPTVPKK
jgi:hypothetical protein